MLIGINILCNMAVCAEYFLLYGSFFPMRRVWCHGGVNRTRLCVQCDRAGLWFAAAADGPGVQPPDWWRAGSGPPVALQHPVQDGAEVAADWLSSVTPPPRSQGRGRQVSADLWPLVWLTVLSFSQTSTGLLLSSVRPGTLLDFRSQDLAEQLTLLDSELFCKIEVQIFPFSFGRAHK